MNKFNVGDEVEVGYRGLPGVFNGRNLFGIIKLVDGPFYGVEFKEGCRSFHDCKGATKEGYGWFVLSDDMTLVDTFEGN